MIDASRLGEMVDSTHRSLSDKDLELISSTYHNWSKNDGTYQDVEGFSKTVTIEEIKNKNYVVAPNRFVNNKNVFNKNIIKLEDVTRNIHSVLPVVELTKQKIEKI